MHVGRRWVRRALPNLDGRALARPSSRTPPATPTARWPRKAVTTADVHPENVLHTVIDETVRCAVGLPEQGMPALGDHLRTEPGTGLTPVNDANLAALGE